MRMNFLLSSFIISIFYFLQITDAQQFRFLRPVPDNIETNGSYLYGEPNFQDQSKAHLGNDILIRYDTVKSASNGIVITVAYKDTINGYEIGGGGNYIIVKSRWNGRDVYIFYMHLNHTYVNENDSVHAGQPIAQSGNTGNSTGPHLHFEIREGNSGYYYLRSRRNPELWTAINGMGAIYGNIPNAPNSSRVDITPDPKPRPPYTTYGYSLTYNFNDSYVGSDDLYKENYAIGDVKPGTYKISAINGSYTRIVTVNAGEVVNADVVTEVSNNNFAITNFELYQNYPNPFNPQTRIEYQLPAECNVKVIVFNSLGQRIKELVNGIKSGGLNEAYFDASDLPSGLYLYTIYASTTEGAYNFTASKKMMFLK